MNMVIQTGTFEARRQAVTERTKEGKPVEFTGPKPGSDGRSIANYVAQRLAWDVANKHTHHLQFNIQFIADALNTAFGGHRCKKIIGTSLHHSKMSIWTESTRYTFDLNDGPIEKMRFLEAMCELVELGEMLGDY